LSRQAQSSADLRAYVWSNVMEQGLLVNDVLKKRKDDWVMRLGAFAL